MPDNPSYIPTLPLLLTALARPLPLPILAPIMNRIAGQSVHRHQALFARLGEHSSKGFQIDPVDLPFVFFLQPVTNAPSFKMYRRGKCPQWDGRIAGPLAALLGMIHGAYDGDALFFSRDITLEGDTAAILALRNAIDNCELDLFEEFMASFGSIGNLALPRMQPIVDAMQKRLGVALRRVEVGL